MVLAADGTVLQYTGQVDGQPLRIPAETLAAARRDGRAAASIPVAGGQPDEAVRVQVRPWSRPDLGLTGYAVAAQTSRKVSQDRAGSGRAVHGLGHHHVGGRRRSPYGWPPGGRCDRCARWPRSPMRWVSRRIWVDACPHSPQQDAVGRLSQSFNAMMDRLQEAYARVATALAAQQRFTADASHELRTPLTTIRNNAEFLMQHPDARPSDRDAALSRYRGRGRTDEPSDREPAHVGQGRRRGSSSAGSRSTSAELAEPVCRQAAALHPLEADRLRRHAGPRGRRRRGLLTQLLWILARQRGQVHRRRRADLGRRDAAGRPGAADGGRQRYGPTARVGARASSTGSTGPTRPAAVAAPASVWPSQTWIVREHGGAVVAANNDRGGATFSSSCPPLPGPTSRPSPSPPPDRSAPGETRQPGQDHRSWSPSGHFCGPGVPSW